MPSFIPSAEAPIPEGIMGISEMILVGIAEITRKRDEIKNLVTFISKLGLEEIKEWDNRCQGGGRAMLSPDGWDFRSNQWWLAPRGQGHTLWCIHFGIHLVYDGKDYYRPIPIEVVSEAHERLDDFVEMMTKAFPSVRNGIKPYISK